ncbi:MAG: hypothetical protein CL781_00355 [Chloroflexi bacterium]|nr:hypothetical protein [Chloroflexota bacterium]
MEHQYIPTEENKKIASEKLTEILFVDDDGEDVAEWLREEFFPKHLPGVEKALAKSKDFDAESMPVVKLPGMVVDMLSSEMFEGKWGIDLRQYIIKRLLEKGEEETLRRIHNWNNKKWKDDEEPTMEKVLKDLKDNQKYPWKPGGSFARKFVEILKFPGIFAGIKSDRSPDKSESVTPRPPMHDLANFQANMRGQITELLADTDNSRAIVSLPTGAGKTRTVVEALLEHWKNSSENNFILWIAQSNELCEQAISCFKQLWEDHKIGKHGETLEIFRTFDDYGLPYPQQSGIIVAGIQKLYSIYNSTEINGESDLDFLKEKLLAVVVDEAHHSVAMSYQKILESLGIDTNKTDQHDSIPLLGLTATPERTKPGETKKLHSLYNNKMIFPSMHVQPDKDKNGQIFDDRWNDLKYMRKRLTELNYLAKPTFHPISVKKFRMSGSETEEMENQPVKDIPENALNRLATLAERNNETRKHIKKWHDKGKQILFFGTNVTQATVMSKILEAEDGIRSATITGTTRYGARKSYIELFKEKKINILCNYNVLTTGFDSPKIDTIVVARPTRSNILLQQMIGRGLRGTEFGGTETCDIVYVKDEIEDDNGKKIELAYIDEIEGYYDE